MEHEQQLAVASDSVLVDFYSTVCSAGCDGRFLQWTVEGDDVELVQNYEPG